MGTVLVTVVWGNRRRDLAVPADVAVADLLRPLAAALADGPPPSRPNDLGRVPADGHGGHGDAGHGHGLALAPRCGQPLPVDRSLDACRIVHGAVLVLIDVHPDAQGRPQGG